MTNMYIYDIDICMCVNKTKVLQLDPDSTNILRRKFKRKERKGMSKTFPSMRAVCLSLTCFDL